MSTVCFPFLAVALIAPQQPEPASVTRVRTSDLIVANGVAALTRPKGSDGQRRVPSAALDLGSGGIDPARRMQAARSEGGGIVSWTSPGGVLVRVADVGVRLDFPSGKQLMVDQRCRVHLRSGEATLPALHGVDLVLADGSRIVMQPSSSSGKRPLRTVVVQDGEVGRTLWQSRRGRRDGRRRREGHVTTSGLVYRVVGEGDLLYETERKGPLIVCERILCAAEDRERYPRERYVVLGDQLVDSLRRLPRVMPEKSEEYPAGPDAARFLAQHAGHLFGDGIRRQPLGAVGSMVVPLDAKLRLELHPGPKGLRFLRLTAPHMAEPIVEWVVGHTTTLHLVRQDAAKPETPRYFQRGVPLSR